MTTTSSSHVASVLHDSLERLETVRGNILRVEETLSQTTSEDEDVEARLTSHLAQIEIVKLVTERIVSEMVQTLHENF